MRQVTPNKLSKKIKKKKNVANHLKKPVIQYGTSQLERDFARDFLDRMKIKYVYQFEAKNIKRFYDFAVTVYDNYPFKYEVKDGINSITQTDKMPTIGFLIEIDGDYW